MIVALAGGVGGARMAAALAGQVPPRALTVVVNTADDFEHFGLTVCPDLDTVMYTLAGVHNPRTGWGRADETWNFMATLAALRGPDWFRLGDRDLAVHALRTAALDAGMTLSQVTRMLCRRFGIRPAVIPMSETPVRTRVATERGELAFQDYFVRLRCRPRVRGFRFPGSRGARVPSALRAIIRSRSVQAVVVCPSNPYVSIAPMLAVPAIRAWLRARTFPVIGVSPIVGGAAIKGPAAKMMRELGVEASALGIVRHYGALVDGWVIDRADRRLAPAIEAHGKAVLVTDTVMATPARSARLAQHLVAFAGEVRRQKQDAG